MLGFFTIMVPVFELMFVWEHASWVLPKIRGVLQC